MDKPTKYPRWADNDTDPGYGGATEPSEDEKGVGWVTYLYQQFLNWWMLLVYQWFAWVDQTTHRTSDLHPDHALPLGDTPSVGAGLSILAADFSARVYANGYEVPLTALADAYTYSPSSDTYWDLGRDGVWYPVVVAAGDPEPAVTSNATRCFMVTTNGSNRTAMADYRASRVRVDAGLDLEGGVRYGDQWLGSDIDAAKVREVTRYRAGVSTGYTHIHSFVDDGGTSPTQPGVHLYVKHDTNELFAVSGATWNGTDWDADPTAAFAYREPIGTQIKTVVTLTIGTVGTNFLDAVWDTEPTASNGISRNIAHEGSFRAGPLSGGSAYLNNLARFISNSSSSDGRVYHASAGGLGIYGLHASDGTGGVGRGGEFVSNATRSASTGQWSRVSAGPSYKLEISNVGVRLLFHDAGAASPWDDTIPGAGDWTNVFVLDDTHLSGLDIQGANLTSLGNTSTLGNSNTTGYATASRFAPTASGVTSPAANAVYKSNICQAHGIITTDGTGAIDLTGTKLFGCSAVVDGSGDLVITLDNAMDDALYTVIPTPGYVTAGQDLDIYPDIIDETSFKLIRQIAASHSAAGAGSLIRKTHFAVFGLAA